MAATTPGSTSPFRFSRCRASGDGQPDLGAWTSPVGGLYALRGLTFDPGLVRTDARGLARYADVLSMPADAEWLDTGDTPLEHETLFGRSVHLKRDDRNPTGSFKDRGMSVLANLVPSVDRPVVVDSVGNTAAAMAAFAEALGLDGHVFVPASASDERVAMLERYGARVHRVAGPRAVSGTVAREASGDGAIYLSHIYHPLFQAGTATCAFELVESLGAAPARVTSAVGQGTLFLGLWHGFRALRAAGVIDRLPELVAVRPTDPPHTVAVGAASVDPVRAQETRDAALASGGAITSASENDIAAADAEFRSIGLVVDPAASLALAGWQELPPPRGAGADVVVVCGAEREPFRPVADS